MPGVKGSIKDIDEKIVDYASLGGSFLGGGGGGSIDEGRLIGKLAVKMGRPKLIDIDDLPEHASIITVSAVGAPASQSKHTDPMDYVKAVEILKKEGVQADGIITSENGGFATLNGWLQSAVLNIPIIDAPCNGRAHPLGLMGSMGLHKIKNYISKQAAAGGDPREERYLEVYTSGSLDNASKIIRQAAVLSGGMVAVARNPVDVGYLRENAAIGALTQAIELGEIMCNAESLNTKIKKILSYLNGEKISEGIIDVVALETTRGFDQGEVIVVTEDCEYELVFWNEYMCLNRAGNRIATFPDLIVTINLDTGLPLTSAEVKKGQNVAILYIQKENLRLGSGMKDNALHKEIEKITGKEILKYL